METKRVSVKRPIRSRARAARLPVVVAAIALPVLAGCSSTVEYATDAYPSQSLVDLLKRPRDAPPPAPSAGSPPPAVTSAPPPVPSSATPPAGEPPPVAASPPRPPAGPPAEADPVAAAFPSVSLIDLLTGARKPEQ
jgi:hypothetical protein